MTGVRPPNGLAVARAVSKVRVDVTMVALDILLITASYSIVLLARFEGRVPTQWWEKFTYFLPAACVVHVATTQLFGAYGRWWRHASIDEARRVLLAGATTTLVLITAFSWGAQQMPISLLLGGPIVATMLMGLVRFQQRLFAYRRNEVQLPGLRVVVVGAGATGANAVREMRQNARLGFAPIAVLDDNPALHGRSLHGVPIPGGIDCLHDLIIDGDVHLVLYAIRTAPPETIKRVSAATNGSGVPVRIIRDAGYWVHGAPFNNLRALTIDDLLGRSQTDIDLQPLRALVHGRRVLVTGGGGSIGSEIARQVASFEPSALVLLDHDETHLHDATHGLPDCETVLGDVRDATDMNALFRRLEPEVVFHAAAHKHVPILERHPCEAVRTNVLGTANVVAAASAAGTRTLVCISTDKAVDPSSVLGASKWLAEQIVLTLAPSGANYCSVRFGNVLGSRGSVIPTFQRQIDAGGPVTVTDPSMTRYFMSIDEAARLVMLAGARNVGPALLALEMGQAVNILELAERMIRLAGFRVGHDIEIEVVGPRPGEKVSESVFGSTEVATHDERDPILHIIPSRIPPSTLKAVLRCLTDLADAGDNARVRDVLFWATSPEATRARATPPRQNGRAAHLPSMSAPS